MRWVNANICLWGIIMCYITYFWARAAYVTLIFRLIFSHVWRWSIAFICVWANFVQVASRLATGWMVFVYFILLGRLIERVIFPGEWYVGMNGKS